MKDNRPIIIVRKKVSHGGHHGGAWKVAYADFVTAMMALFIVLWLLNTSKPVREAIAGYFKDPSGTGEKTGTQIAGKGEGLTVSKDNMDKLREEIQKSFEQLPDFERMKKQVEMTITSEGLRIELLETDSGIFFDLGSPRPTPEGRELLVALAAELGKIPNKLSIEGHTDSKPYAKGREYGNWELSTERANSARRVMQESGLRADQVSQVRGFADQKLRKPDAPFDASNRRISVIVHYSEEQVQHASEGIAKPDGEAKRTGEERPAEPSKESQH